MEMSSQENNHIYSIFTVPECKSPNNLENGVETKISINITDNNVQLLRNVIKSVLPRQKV